jgi:hypothetical protein
VLGPEGGDPRLQPQVGEVGSGGNVNLGTALQIEQRRRRFQLAERRAQMGDGGSQGGGGLETRAAAHEQIDTEIVLERLQPLTDGGGRDPQDGGRRLQRSGAERQLQRLQRAKMWRRRHESKLKVGFSDDKII